MNKGRIIVLEGLDSSGKATQTRLLREKLEEKGIKTKVYSFPRYNELFGRLIAKYLKGELGEKESLPKEFVPILYSLDRYEVKKEIEEKLNQGFALVMDRYYTSNFAYQSAKFTEENKRKEFIEWMKKIESRMPSPDLVFFLDVPVGFSQKLMDSRKQKEYMQEKKDIYEKDVGYQQKVRTAFLELCDKESNWIKIKCVSDNRLKTKEEISELIWKSVE